MILEYIHPDNTKEHIAFKLQTEVVPQWTKIDPSNKIDFIQHFIPAYFSGQRSILFDTNHKQLLDFYNEHDINQLDRISTVNKTSMLLFFTSGSSGFPVGAFKSKENLEREVQVLSGLLKEHKIKRVVVTVPFVHIYGVLAGLLLPLHLDDVTLVVKDDFLPYELLDEARQDDTLVITTPLFIKALARVERYEDLSSALFVCSTGPLHSDDITCFEEKFTSKVLQLFGSTETGGIAYRFSASGQWEALPSVSLGSKDERLNVVSPFISPYLLDKEIVPLGQPFQTEDIVVLEDNRFELLGRSNKLIKIAGKRISALQIESLLESIADVNKAIVTVVYKKELLRSEQISITLEASQKIDGRVIKKKIAESYGTLTIPFTITYVDRIDHSAMGKKVLF